MVTLLIFANPFFFSFLLLIVNDLLTVWVGTGGDRLIMI